MAYTTINKGSSYFNGLAYSGNNTATAYNNGLDMSTNGGWVWLKTRSASGDHGLFDSVRGINKRLISNSTNAEDTLASNGVTSFNSTGFSLGTVAYNDTPYTFMSWSWIAGGTGVSNTSGTISSTVSVNTTAGFSIATFTGTGVAGITVGHGLGVTPSMMIVKSRGTTGNWLVYHKSLGNTGGLILEGTSVFTANTGYWNNTSPTSSVFTLGTFTPASTAVAYCFAEVKGYSKFGSYTGNGSANGTFVYTGFKPAFIIIKRTDVAQSWILFDNKRDPYNEATKVLYPNLSNAEDANNLDLLSNGFKPRSTSSFTNSSGNNFIYMAFAENPFVSSTQIPTTAR
jgi:hypothetical protein